MFRPPGGAHREGNVTSKQHNGDLRPPCGVQGEEMALKAGGLPPEPRYLRVFVREKGICSERGGGSRLIHRSVSENYFFGHVFLSLIYIKRDMNPKFCCVKWRSKGVFAQPYNVHACLSAKRAKAVNGFCPLQPCFSRKTAVAGHYRALTKPVNAKIARKRRKTGGNFRFLRQLHMQSAVAYVQARTLACKFASLACRLSHHSGSLLILSTSCGGRRPPTIHKARRPMRSGGVRLKDTGSRSAPRRNRVRAAKTSGIGVWNIGEGAPVFGERFGWTALSAPVTPASYVWSASGGRFCGALSAGQHCPAKLAAVSSSALPGAPPKISTVKPGSAAL